MEECIFCKITAGGVPAEKVYEDDKVLAFLDINPINQGHTLLIPKAHAENLLEASEESLIDVIKAVKKLAPAIISGVGAKSFNFGLNNGQESGQVVKHIHFHLIPRFAGDGHKLWGGKPYKEGQAKEVAEKIKNNL